MAIGVGCTGLSILTIGTRYRKRVIGAASWGNSNLINFFFFEGKKVGEKHQKKKIKFLLPESAVQLVSLIFFNFPTIMLILNENC